MGDCHSVTSGELPVTPGHSVADEGRVEFSKPLAIYKLSEKEPEEMGTFHAFLLCVKL